LYNEVLMMWQIVGMVLVLGGIILLGKTNSTEKSEEDVV